MELAIGTIVITILLSVVVYSLLAFVTGNKVCGCAQVHKQGDEAERGSCCTNLEKRSGKNSDSPGGINTTGN